MSKFITLLLIFSISDIFSQTPNWTAKFMLQGPSGDMDTVWIGCSEYGAEGYQDTLDIIDTEFTGPVSIRSYDDQVEDEFGFGTCTNLRKNIKGFVTGEAISFTIYVLSSEYPYDDSLLLSWDTLDFIFNENEYQLTYVELETQLGYISGIDNDFYSVYHLEINDGDTTNEFTTTPTELFPIDTITNCSNGNWAQIITVNVYFNLYPVEILEEDLGSNIVIYPNPVYSNLFIQNLPYDKNTCIEILSIDGHQVYMSDYSLNMEMSITNISNLTPGIYLVHVFNSDYSFSYLHKIVKL